jgi:hypothetical protein
MKRTSFLSALLLPFLVNCTAGPVDDPKDDTDTGQVVDTGNGVLCEDSYAIATVAEMAEIAHCTRIGGDLLINGDFDALELPNLLSVGGDLTLGNTGAMTSPLASLVGLDALQSVDGSFRIEHLGNINPIDGLPNLTTVGVLDLYHLFGLKNIKGFKALTTVGSLKISSHDQLQRLDGFNNLVDVNRINISWNVRLCESKAQAFFDRYPEAVTVSEMNKSDC